jgi:hypothetical protein
MKNRVADALKNFSASIPESASCAGQFHLACSALKQICFQEPLEARNASTDTRFACPKLFGSCRKAAQDSNVREDSKVIQIEQLLRNSLSDLAYI